MSDTWSLNDIYTGFDAEALVADFNKLSPMVDEMNKAAAALADFNDVEKLVRQLESYTALLDKIGSFASFSFSTDTSNTDAEKYLYQMDTLNAETSRTQVRLAAFLAKLSKTGDITELAEAQGIGEYAYQLNYMAQHYAHLMSEDEETLAAQMVNTGSGAWNMMQDKLISHLTCEYADPAKNGEVRRISINECRNLAYSPDYRVRKAAYEAELAAYPQIEEASAAALSAIKGEVNLLCRLRRFENPLDKTLFTSAMTPKTLGALIEAINKNAPAFRDYMKAKAAYLAKKQGTEYTKGLPFYEMFAPVGESAGAAFDYDRAKQFVTDNFARFSPGMAKVAQDAFEKNWIDIYPRDGKVSGAFCGDIFAIKQFRILLNYGNSLSDAITLAHELGHGYHSMQIMHEGILNTNYPMPLAETASTFCETIVTNAALAEMKDDEKLQLLENSLQDATQVLLDIYSRFLFEQQVFEARLDHPLSPEELKGFMLEAQRAAYGDGLDPDLLHPYMWVIKPHYYSGSMSYYNFPYAFGHLLANGLYQIYEKDPAAFGEKYDKFLRATGKMSIKDSCKMLGVDVEDAAFWNGAIDVIKKNIDEFKRITL
ncbi:MAG: M3 family oligoendopeptidase [Defluviitaleaceae bacterium]|nr:M3 family oligoendopeptidase [Defluviitaleaceae bacterium]MCL2240211.1 M3 family oligoendopeptidase [Defluviitaleaceae bacterium]